MWSCESLATEDTDAHADVVGAATKIRELGHSLGDLPLEASGCINVLEDRALHDLAVLTLKQCVWR